jgi:hypothetical protein
MNVDKISIPSPCNEQWNTMTPKDNGRHCNTCKETVVDFTSMTTDEIKNYFEKNAGSKICGNYKITQVETPLPVVHKKLLELYTYFQHKISLHFFKVGLLSFITVCLIMTSCKTRLRGKYGGRPGPTKGKMHMTKEKVHIALITEKKTTDS